MEKAKSVANLNNSSTPSTIAKPDRSKDKILAHNTALCSPYFESKRESHPSPQFSFPPLTVNYKSTHYRKKHDKFKSRLNHVNVHQLPGFMLYDRF